MNKALIIVVVLLVLAVGFLYIDRGSDKDAGYIRFVATITNTSSTVGMTDTLVLTPAGYQYFKMTATETSGARTSCGFSTTSTLITTATSSAVNNTGIIIYSATSSLDTSFETRDANKLAKYLHCISTATSTFGILKY